jgi:NADPH:quinone reductase-like Zn-dependent oxidoreductase
MKAIVYTRYGPPDVLQLKEVEKPVPSENQVLLKVHAASVNPLDYHFMRGTPYLVRIQSGLREPRDIRLGVDVAGQVEAVGKNVTQFQVGDEVFGGCKGAFAEYAGASEQALVHKPANITYEQAASVSIAALTALQGLRDKGEIQAGQKVLINGAAGGVGTFAVQIAKSFGAHVTGVCSTRNVDMVKAIGADHVIDYTEQDFTRMGQRYDLIFDSAGSHSLFATRRALTRAGRLVLVGGSDKGRLLGPMSRTIRAVVLGRLVSQKLVPFLAAQRKDDLIILREMLEAGKLTPVIDRAYPLHEVPEAVRYLETGHARGKVVILLQPSMVRAGD